ncbi:hypothetical protein [Aeoliella sp. SH292]|uniref:hypothetical protein n=1 Tax=Aeoliella sp. SH292 TaxID=3454464 RepID=UPI003F9DE686
MPRFNLRTLLTSVTAFCVVLSVWLLLVTSLVESHLTLRFSVAIGAFAAVGVTLAINQHQPSESQQPILAEAVLLSAMCLMISAMTVPMAMLMFGD